MLTSTHLLGANFQNPADTRFHLSIGIGRWFVYFSLKGRENLGVKKFPNAVLNQVYEQSILNEGYDKQPFR